MHGFDPRRIDEDLVERPRQRRVVELAARELDGDQLLRLAVAVELKEIGADGGGDRIEKAAQDAVLVEALDLLQRGLDRRHHGVLPRIAFEVRHAEVGIEPGVEQGHELRRDAGVPAQRRPHVILRIGDMESAAETATACG